ncbi:MAG: permease [Deltaproteobacteria bacterium]|nr:permease [Deltaproteobacteria bacterium]
MIQHKTKEKVEEKGKAGIYSGMYFSVTVVWLYLLLYFFQTEKIQQSIKTSGIMLIQILPALFFIILLMGIMNYFVSPKAVSNYVGKGSGIRGWLLAIFAGVLSHGPVYAWYPLLRDLRNQGMKSSLVAVFLYNRAIKIPLLHNYCFYRAGPDRSNN